MNLKNEKEINKNHGVCVIENIKVAMAAVEAVIRLTEKQKLQKLNNDEIEALKTFDMGFRELIVQAVTNMKITHLK